MRLQQRQLGHLSDPDQAYSPALGNYGFVNHITSCWEFEQLGDFTPVPAGCGRWVGVAHSTHHVRGYPVVGTEPYSSSSHFLNKPDKVQLLNTMQALAQSSLQGAWMGRVVPGRSEASNYQ